MGVFLSYSQKGVPAYPPVSPHLKRFIIFPVFEKQLPWLQLIAGWG